MGGLLGNEVVGTSERNGSRAVKRWRPRPPESHIARLNLPRRREVLVGTIVCQQGVCLLCCGWWRWVSRLRRGPATGRRGAGGRAATGAGADSSWPGRVSGLGGAPTRLATAGPRQLALACRGWACCGLWQVGGPLDHQAGGLVGGARVFGFITPCPTGGTPMIMLTSYCLLTFRCVLCLVWA